MRAARGSATEADLILDVQSLRLPSSSSSTESSVEGQDFSLLALHLHPYDFPESCDCVLEREGHIMEYNDREG